jgi:hypothetical protein
VKFAGAQLEALDSVIRALAKKPKYDATTKQLKLLQAKLTKMDAPKPKSGIGVDRAIVAMQEVLGKLLAVPKNPSAEWKMYLARRIRDLGLTEDDCRTIARTMMVKWNPPFGFEYGIKAADRLLAESSTVTKYSKTKASAPVEMGDD